MVEVGPAYAVVDPEAIGLIPVDDLVGYVAVLGSGWADHLCVGTQLVGGHGLQKLLELKLIPVVSLHIAWVLVDAHVEDYVELDADQQSRHHEVVHIEDYSKEIMVSIKLTRSK